MVFLLATLPIPYASYHIISHHTGSQLSGILSVARILIYCAALEGYGNLQGASGVLHLVLDYVSASLRGDMVWLIYLEMKEMER